MSARARVPASGGRARLAASLLALACLASPTLAHDQPYSWLDLRLSPSGLEGRVTAHVVDLAHEAGIAAPESLLAPGGLAAHADALEAMLTSRLVIAADGRPLAPEWTGAEAVPEKKALAFTWRSAWPRMPGVLRIEGPLFRYESQHDTYVNVYEAGVLRHQDLLDASRTTYDYYTGTRQGLAAVVRTFLVAGIHHIFIGPDHILFIVGLLLLGGSALRLLKIVTAFTLAHSVTLALATLGLLTPPAPVVEPVIALSIVAVGLGNLRVRRGGTDARVWAALGFGLIHGFGFASVLREFGLPREALGASLFAFNAGVEVGQACIVAAVATLLALIRWRAPAVERRVVALGSLAVVAAGAWWFVERAFLSRP